jgi:glycerophosphoryl diester phosphodiesterase
MPTLGEALDFLIQARLKKGRDDLKIYIEIKTNNNYSHTMSQSDIAQQIKEDLAIRNMLDDNHVWIQSFDDEMMDVIATDSDFDNLDKCQLGLDSAKEIANFRNKRKAKKYLKKEVVNRNLQMLHIWKVAAKLFIEKRNIPLVELAHGKNIPIHLYTFRDPQYSTDYKAFKTLGLEGFDSIEEELEYFINSGVDAIMTDYVTSALEVRKSIYDK